MEMTTTAAARDCLEAAVSSGEAARCAEPTYIRKLCDRSECSLKAQDWNHTMNYLPKVHQGPRPILADRCRPPDSRHVQSNGWSRLGSSMALENTDDGTLATGLFSCTGWKASTHIFYMETCVLCFGSVTYHADFDALVLRERLIQQSGIRAMFWHARLQLQRAIARVQDRSGYLVSEALVPQKSFRFHPYMFEGYQH